LRGSELRELTSRRRAAVRALVEAAVGLAAGRGANAATLPRVEVETTLTAALADADLAQVVRAGRLLKSGQYDGFGGVPVAVLRSVPTAAVVPSVAPPADPPRTRAPDPGRLKQAASALAEAESGYAAAVAAVEARTREVDDLEEQLTALRRRRRDAHAAVLSAQAASDAAAVELESARRRHAAAERAAKRA
jgi:hypothetical protein